MENTIKIRKMKPILYLSLLALVLITMFSSCDYDVDNATIPDPIEAATITNVSPTTGGKGSIIEIQGTNFGHTKSNNWVTINGIPVEVISASDTLLTIKVPLDATSGNLVVSHGGFTVEGPVITVLDMDYGQGIFPYTRYEPLKHKPAYIHYYIPEDGNKEEMPILLVFHGNSRNAAGALRSWLPIAKEKNIMVFTVELKSDIYSGLEYHRGGVVLNNTPQPVENWTFSMIDPIFEFIKEQTNSNQEKYDVYGHSAGGQFVHRMMLFTAIRNKVNRAIAANPGYYTLPDVNDIYPFGIDGTLADETYLEPFFNSNLVIMLGTEDNDPNAKDLPTGPGTAEQGPHRFARGHYFWSESKAISDSYNYNFNWELIEVEGVGHQSSKMNAAAGKHLYY